MWLKVKKISKIIAKMRTHKIPPFSFTDTKTQFHHVTQYICKIFETDEKSKLRFHTALTQNEIHLKTNYICRHNVLSSSPKNRRICQQKRCCQNRLPLLRRKVRQSSQGRASRGDPCWMRSSKPRNGMVSCHSNARGPVSC